MTKSTSGPSKSGPGAASRKARLAQALRANLKRRKAQAKGRGEARDEAGSPDDVRPVPDGAGPRGGDRG